MFELKAPDEPQLWLRYAGLRLQQGNMEGYRAVCSRMADKFASDDKDDPIWLSLACCLGSDALPSLKAQTRRLEEVIKSSGQSFPWTTTAVLAAVDYRAGRFDEAERRLNELGDPAVWGDNAGGSLFLLIGALIEHRKGKDDLAERRFLQAADRRLEKNLQPRHTHAAERSLGDDRGGGRPGPLPGGCRRDPARTTRRRRSLGSDAPSAI